MGKLIVIVLATLAALPRVWTELHDRWLKRETSRILTSFQIIRHYKNLGESKHLKFD
jgi:hypothetical protein